ncbi:hypothetical protein [Leifsonia sp. 2MCAF36]|uniref:hypothetical protein n=1 Tax=Leifsonia sp. 2MCAF36 TaxID=3232988 RepID=UPI003F96F12B
MKKLTLLVAAAIVLTISGCSAPPLSGTAPVALVSARPSVSAPASATPATPGTSTNSATPTAAAPTPSAAAPADGGAVSNTTPDPQRVQPVQPTQPAQPSPAPDPNGVDPAGYASHAIDPGNGGVALPGLEFMTADGNVICGIKPTTDGAPGFATCTPSTWRTVIPQNGNGMPEHAVILFTSNAAGWLFPDLYSQPARTIPVLPEGKSIRLESITCSVSGGAVTCVNAPGGADFVVSTAAVTYHN